MTDIKSEGKSKKRHMSDLETFGKYLLVERLAAGGMAEVFLAKSTGAVGISKFLAIKRILPQYSDNPEFIEMFKEEARIAMNLNHGNVVTIYDFGVESRQFYLVMEYVEGQNLRQILNHLKKEHKEFSIEQCIYIAKQVAAGLDHAHRCIDSSTGRPLNITHRDMSPQNIMISFEGEVKVVDFGIAKAETQMEHTRVGTIKGKFGYMSPEQAEGYQVDARTDIFSLGIVLWEILAQDRLFTGSSEAATLRKIRDCQIPSLRRINPAIPPELERIVNKALSKDKSLRYQAASALHRDLNRFLNIQFPEFSAQDFAVFMKSAFSQMYIENRKKQVEYAKLQGPISGEDQTLVTKTDTKTDTNQANFAPSAPAQPTSVQAQAPPQTQSQAVVAPQPTAPPAASRNQPVSSLSSPSIRTEKLKEESYPFAEIPLDTSTQTKVDLKQLRLKNRAVNTFGPTEHTSFTNTAALKMAQDRERDSDHVVITRQVPQRSVFTIVFLVVTVAFTVYFGIKKNFIPTNFLPPELAAMIGIENAADLASSGRTPDQKTPIKVPDNPGQQHVPVVQIVTFTIESSPPGARIYIDGKDTGAITPNRRQIDANQEFRLGLSKDGYSYFEKLEKITTDGTTLKLNLQPPPPMGYVSINVVNGGTDPVVYINNQRVNQKPPIRFYGIPAGVPVKVRILNPFTQLAAEKIVTVNATEKKELTLVLSREASGQ